MQIALASVLTTAWLQPVPTGSPAPASPVSATVAPGAAAPAAANAQPPAADPLAGPWVIGQPRYYTVRESAQELVTSPDNPDHKTERTSEFTYYARITPIVLEGEERRFELTLVRISGEWPTPLGKVVVDTAVPPRQDDDVSKLMNLSFGKIIGAPLTLTLRGDRITEVKGNEELLNSRGGRLMRPFLDDGVLALRFGYCLLTGAPGGKLDKGTTWPVERVGKFRDIIALSYPASAAVESVSDGTALIRFTPAPGASATPVAQAQEVLGPVEAEVKENIADGELRWSIGDGRLISGQYTAGFVLLMKNIGGMKGQQRDVRTFTITRAGPPSAADFSKPAHPPK